MSLLGWIIPCQINLDYFLISEVWRAMEPTSIFIFKPTRINCLKVSPLRKLRIRVWIDDFFKFCPFIHRKRNHSTRQRTSPMNGSLARNRGEDDSEVIRHLSQRVAVVLARLNASMLLNRAPQNTPANIDGVNWENYIVVKLTVAVAPMWTVDAIVVDTVAVGKGSVDPDSFRCVLK